MNKQEALAILGLSGDPTEEEIKKSYRKLAIKNHPDKHKGSKEYEERFKRIQNAYTFLTDPQSQFGSSVDPFFEKMANDFNAAFGFNSRRRQQEKFSAQENPCDKKIHLSDANIGEYLVTLNQVLFREEISLSLKVQACCSQCLSNKQLWYMCPACNGIGKLNQTLRTPIGVINQVSQCPHCNGLGWVKNNHCKVCNDRLVYLKDKTINFKIPNNFVLGSTIRLAERGNEGWNVPMSSIFIEPKVTLPNLDSLTEDEKVLLKNLLHK